MILFRCYALSGLSIAQNCIASDLPLPNQHSSEHIIDIENKDIKSIEIEEDVLIDDIEYHWSGAKVK